MSFFSPLFHRRPLIGVAAVLLIATVGCGGSRTLSSPDVGDMANWNLPRVRTVAHPDSLQRVTIVEEKNRVRINLADRYERLHRAWSSSFQFQSPNREIQNPLTYATLWGKELSLAALQAEENLASLSIEEARTRIKEHREAYRETLQIDVYWFSGPYGSPITGPGAQVRLRDGQGNYYSPSDEDSGPLRQAFLRGGNTALYRRNTFYFDRTEDGRDILDGASALYLRVSPTRGPTVQFGWSWTPR